MRLRSSAGFSFVEIMVTVAIVSLMAAGGFAALSAGENSWFTAEAGIEVQESLRQSLDQMTAELRESKFSQVALSAGAGYNGTDIIKFSIPVICHTGDNLLDGNGDVAHWGATTKWGCHDVVCMDLDDDCATVDYKYIQYELVAGNNLVRKVLDNNSVLVRQDTMAHSISDFKVVQGATNTIITLTVKAQVTSVLKRPVTAMVQNNVVFRNQ